MRKPEPPRGSDGLLRRSEWIMVAYLVYAAVLAHLLPARPPIPAVTAVLNLTVVAGDSAALSVTAVGTTPFSYQWLLFGTNFSGPNAATEAWLDFSNSPIVCLSFFTKG